MFMLSINLNHYTELSTTQHEMVTTRECNALRYAAQELKADRDIDLAGKVTEAQDNFPFHHNCGEPKDQDQENTQVNPHQEQQKECNTSSSNGGDGGSNGEEKMNATILQSSGRNSSEGVQQQEESSRLIAI